MGSFGTLSFDMGRLKEKKDASISDGGPKGTDLSTFKSFMAVCTSLCGLVCLGAGVMGFYWGTTVIKPWPPLTWNNCVGGFFMIVFGIMLAVVGLNGISSDAGAGEYAATTQEWAGFIDNFMGRGLFFCYLGLRIMPLGKYYCLMAGLCLLFFGFGNIIVHFLWVAPVDKAMLQINRVSGVIAAIVCIAGGMGFYWGTKVIKPWPPLTWNNCVGGLFMFAFGVMIFVMFVGLRIVPLGQFYCLVAGMVTFSFGALNCAVHFMHNKNGEPIRISNQKTIADVGL